MIAKTTPGIFSNEAIIKAQLESMLTRDSDADVEREETELTTIRTTALAIKKIRQTIYAFITVLSVQDFFELAIVAS